MSAVTPGAIRAVPLLPDEDENPVMDLYAALATAGEQLLLAAGGLSAMMVRDERPTRFDLREIDRWLDKAVEARRRYGERA